MGRPRRPRSDGQKNFGAVLLTEFQAEGKPAENVIVKKLLSTAQDVTAQKRCFIQGRDVMATMLEYVYFDLETFGGEGKVSSLKNFLSCLDQNDCQRIGPTFMEKIGSDVQKYRTFEE